MRHKQAGGRAAAALLPKHRTADRQLLAVALPLKLLERQLL